MSRRRARGAATVEFALLLPVLVLLAAGAIDLGDAWFRSSAAAGASRAVGIAAFDAGPDRLHDLRVLNTVVTEFDNRRIENVERVVVFDATGITAVPPNCLGTAALSQGGIAGTCVVYDRTFLDRVRAGTAEPEFVHGNCNASVDRRWCTETRPNAAGWMVGVHVQANESTLMGVIPWLRSFEVNETVIVQEFDRG